MNEEDVIAVFTARSPERIIKEGGSQAWILNPVRAKLCKWLVCTQNRHNPDHKFSDATEPHGSAFLVGNISGITKSEENPEKRWIVQISEFAHTNKPDVWKSWRNPVRYTTLSELGICVDELDFKKMPQADIIQDQHVPELKASPPAMLTITEAKKALAATFGVKPEEIEIVIRG